MLTQQDYGNITPAFIDSSAVDRQRPVHLNVSVGDRMSSGDSVDEDSAADKSAPGREG